MATGYLGFFFRPLPFHRREVPGGWDGPFATAVVFGAGIVGFTLLVLGSEVALGNPLVNARTPGVSHSLEDALWHLTAGFLLALPVLRRTALWLVPILSLGLDVDHVFGSVLPTVTTRTAHSLLVVAGIGLLLSVVQGRTGALVGSGAILGHMAVDGGSFPLFGPFSTNAYSFPLPLSAVLLFGVACLFVLAFRSEADLRRPMTLGLVVAVTVVLVALMAVLPASTGFLAN